MSGNGAILFSFDYPPNSGGIARLCSSLTHELGVRGIRMRVLTTPESHSVDRFCEGLDLRLKSSRRPLREFEAWKRLLSVTGAVISGTWYPEGLIAALSGSCPSVVMAHGAELFPAQSLVR